MRYLCIALLLVGCNHKLEPMPLALQEKLTQALEKKELRTLDVEALRDITWSRQMSEDAAVQIWLETGVYRGKTDEEWIETLILRQYERE